MDIQEIKLKTLANEPVIIDNYKLYPKRLRDIVRIGYDNYNIYLSLFCINEETLNKFINGIKESNEKYKPTYLGYLNYLYVKSNYDRTVIDALTFFTGEKFYHNKSGFFYYIGKVIDPITLMEKDYAYILDDNIFKQITQIIKIQSCLLDEQIEVTKDNPANSHVQALLEKRRKAREKLKKAKQNSGEDDDEGLTLYDLASIVASNCNGINILNVWDLNFLQFNDQLNRMKMLEDYNVNIQSLLAGADSKNINLVHWMSKIKRNED